MQLTTENNTTTKHFPVLGQGGLHPLVAALDFERLKWKLSHSSEAKMSPAMCDKSELEYRRFLTLKLLFPGESLVPCKVADEFWHAHILDTEAYIRDCQALFGRYLHHFPYFGIYGEEDQRALNRGFDRTTNLYENVFGPRPDFSASADCSERCKCESFLNGAARCEDHPCHAPSECACRSPGACK